MGKAKLFWLIVIALGLFVSLEPGTVDGPFTLRNKNMAKMDRRT